MVEKFKLKGECYPRLVGSQANYCTNYAHVSCNSLQISQRDFRLNLIMSCIWINHLCIKLCVKKLCENMPLYANML